MATTKKGAWLKHPDIPLLRTMYRGDAPFEELTSRENIKIQCGRCSYVKVMTLGNWLKGNRNCYNCKYSGRTIPQSKLCKTCNQEKPIDEFRSTQRKMVLSFDTYCRDCECADVLKRYYKLRTEEPYKAWLQSSLVQAKIRAREQGVSFALTQLDIDQQWTGACGYCQRILVFNEGKTRLLACPTLDKIIPTVGYTLSNVVIVCFRCNTSKSNASVEEIEALAVGLRRVIEARKLLRKAG